MKITLSLLGLLLAACGGPPPNASTAPAPASCGPFEVTCTTQHTCCPSGFACGGEPASVGVPPGECEFVEPTDVAWARRDGGASTDAGAYRRVKQRPLP
jgi:hypothetical protein